jgi:glycosyltransferase involved in cell wall biosynthesis
MMNQQTNPKTIWIAWQRHRRTIELNKVFGAKLIVFECTLPRIIKHPLLLFKTFWIISTERPKILIVQNPSVILTLAVTFLKPLYGYKLIVDAHNAGLMPTTPISKPFLFLYRFMQKNADLTIVTNIGLAKLVKNNSGIPYVLPDRIPDVDLLEHNKTLKGKATVLFISTFGKDEPFLEVIEAAKLVDKDIFFYISGDYKSKFTKHEEIPPNVIFTGYLSEKDYWAMLKSVNLAIDLTYRENCLVCGAYESVAAETPMILSNTSALKKYFYKGSIFSNNNHVKIAAAINKALRKHNCLKKEVIELKKELSSSWDERANNIVRILQTNN